jgi:hypothetical protein
MSKFNGVKARVMVSREVDEAKLQRAVLAGAGGLSGAAVGMLVGSVVGAAVTSATLLPKWDGDGAIPNLWMKQLGWAQKWLWAMRDNLRA